MTRKSIHRTYIHSRQIRLLYAYMYLCLCFVCDVVDNLFRGCFTIDIVLFIIRVHQRIFFLSISFAHTLAHTSKVSKLLSLPLVGDPLNVKFNCVLRRYLNYDIIKVKRFVFFLLLLIFFVACVHSYIRLCPVYMAFKFAIEYVSETCFNCIFLLAAALSLCGLKEKRSISMVLQSFFNICHTRLCMRVLTMKSHLVQFNFTFFFQLLLFVTAVNSCHTTGCLRSQQ